MDFFIFLILNGILFTINFIYKKYAECKFEYEIADLKKEFCLSQVNLNKPYKNIGTYNEHEFRVELLTGRKAYFKTKAVITIIPPEEFQSRISLMARYSHTVLPDMKVMVLTGDSEFDSNFILKGNTPFIFAGFNSDTREKLLKIKPGSIIFEINEKKIVYNAALENVYYNNLNLVLIIKSLISISAQLMESKRIFKKLSDNALTDPVPEFRKACLELLYSNTVDKLEINIILEKALKDSNQEVSLLAAKYLKEDAVSFLLKRIENTDSIEEVLPVFDVLTLNNNTELINPLIRIYRKYNNNYLRSKTADYFHNLASEAVCEFLIEELEKTVNYELKISIIRAIGSCGNRESIEPLNSLLNKPGVNPELKPVIINSIRQIQAGLIGTDAGQLSISEMNNNEGSLSIASEQGALSMDEEIL